MADRITAESFKVTGIQRNKSINSRCISSQREMEVRNSCGYWDWQVQQVRNSGHKPFYVGCNPNENRRPTCLPNTGLGGNDQSALAMA